MLIFLWVPGCTAPGSTTRITGGDLDLMVHEMIQSLAASDFIRQRGADSPPAVIVINKVQNLSSDIVTEAEQWMTVARVRGALPLQIFSRAKHITFQLTPERRAMLRRAGYDSDTGPATPPTHLMAATFRSIRRAGRAARQELTNLRAETYYMEFTITDIQTRRIEWVGQFSFKRHARGLLID